MVSTIDQVNKLLTQLQSPDFYEREEAVQQLGRCETTEAIAGLVIALEDADMGIRELAADLLCSIRGDVAAQLLINFLAHGDIGTRNLAAEILVRFGSDAVPALIAEIDNDDHDVRKFIVDVLGMIGDERATEAVCSRLNDSNLNVICSAAEALGEIGAKDAIPELVAAYRRTPDARLQAVEALGKIGDPATLPYLIEFLDSDDPVVLYAAIEALGHLTRQESVDHLIPFLEHQDSTIAEAALAAIINISINNDGRIGHDLPLDKFSDFLFDGIRNRDPKITNFTLGHLSHWYGSKVVQSLLDVVGYVEDEDLKRIVEILGQIGPSASDLILKKFPKSSTTVKLVFLNILKQYVDEDIARALLPFAKDSDPDVRQNIAFVLGLSSCQDTIPVLTSMTKDMVGHVRSAAYAALGWVGSESELDVLFEGLNDRYGDVREATMGALLIIGGPRVVQVFSRNLYHEDVECQRLAVTALGMIGDTSVVDPLLQALNHPEASIRKSAADSLAKIGEVNNIGPLILVLNDENSAVRKAAISALFAIKGEEILPEIRLVLEDEDVWVRYHAINLIGELQNPQYGDYIINYLASDQDIIRLATIKALARMGCKEALVDIEKLKYHKNKDIQEAATSALQSLQTNS